MDTRDNRALWWFLLPLSASFLWILLGRCFVNFSGGSFDGLGTGWIVLNGLYNGAILGSISVLTFVAFQMRSSNKSAASVAIVAAVMLAIISHLTNDDGNFESIRDRAIRRLGYVLFFAPWSRTQSVGDRPAPSGFKPVLTPHECVEFSTPNGDLAIKAGNGLRRTFCWKGEERSIELLPECRRTWMEPEDPSHFLVSHCRRGERWPGFDWLEHDGTTRGNVVEACVNFNGEGPALSWIRANSGELLPLVHTRNGLVLGWSKGTDIDTLTVVIFQVLINGEKPHDLALSDDSKIRVFQR